MDAEYCELIYWSRHDGRRDTRRGSGIDYKRSRRTARLRLMLQLERNKNDPERLALPGLAEEVLGASAKSD